MSFTVTYDHQDSHGGHDEIIIGVDHIEETNVLIPVSHLYDANDVEIDRIATDHIVSIDEE